MPTEAPKWHLSVNSHLLEHHLRGFFQDLCDFLMKSSCFSLCFQDFVFIEFFMCFWTGRNSEIDQKHRAGQQQLRVLKIKQNRSRARFGMNLGVIFGVQLVTNVVFCWKNECRKTEWQKGTPEKWNYSRRAGPRAPGQPPLKSTIVRVIKQLNKN